MVGLAHLVDLWKLRMDEARTHALRRHRRRLANGPIVILRVVVLGTVAVVNQLLGSLALHDGRVKVSGLNLIAYVLLVHLLLDGGALLTNGSRLFIRYPGRHNIGFNIINTIKH